jgi:hypothetical protein
MLKIRPQLLIGALIGAGTSGAAWLAIQYLRDCTTERVYCVQTNLSGEGCKNFQTICINRPGTEWLWLAPVIAIAVYWALTARKTGAAS